MLGCTTNTSVSLSTLKPEGTGDTYILMKLGQGTEDISKIVIHNLTNRTDYLINIEANIGSLYLKSIPAGDYYLKRIDVHHMRWGNVRTITLSQPKLLTIIKTGDINYVGDFEYKLLETPKIIFEFAFIHRNKSIAEAKAKYIGDFPGKFRLHVSKNLVSQQ